MTSNTEMTQAKPAEPHPVASDDTDSHKARTIELHHVSHTFVSDSGQPVEALRDVSFTVHAGGFVSVVGPSGCGKSTIVNIISGLLMPTEGQVTVGDREVKTVRNDVQFMQAHDTLLPWRTVLRNVEFPLQYQDLSKQERRSRARETLAALGLGEFEDSYPYQLSQGMRQRVAIARTFATRASIVLMDEPFSALDSQTRVLVQDMFLQAWERDHPTVVLITHDVAEAVALSDSVVVFSDRPGTVVSNHRIDLPRPRSVENLIFENVLFQQYMRTIWSEIRTSIPTDR
jgi:NitT/TauT family transport system ATP-binding protein